MDFFQLQEVYPTKTIKKGCILLKREDQRNTTSKKTIHKTLEETGELLGNKIIEKIVKLKPKLLNYIFYVNIDKL